MNRLVEYTHHLNHAKAMKQIHLNIKNSCAIAMLLLASGLQTACTNDIFIASADENNYATNQSGDALGYVTDQDGKQMFSTATFRSSGTTTLFFNLSKKAGEQNLISYKYDKSALDAYNAETGNSYEALPEAQVTLGSEGMDTLKVGTNRSAGLAVTYTDAEGMDTEKSYVIPLRATVASGSAKFMKGSDVRLIFVKDLSGIADCDKGPNHVELFSCMEVNGTNPLDNLCFTLKNSGKYMVDYLIMFSANINYDETTGRAYLFNNENVQAILDNRKKYLQPLKDRGMKIILGILGNHDRAGVANLSDDMARNFAKEVKATCDMYDLDGIFLDDEYTESVSGAPGFVSSGGAAAGRLYYELKKLQPDRINIAYVYSSTSRIPNVKDLETGVEHQAGDFVDYGLHDYGGSYDLSSNYPGMPKAHMGLYSQEFARGRWATEANLKKMKDNGYGAHMIFAMSTTTSNFQSEQLPAMQKIARAFYDDECVYDGNSHPADWK
jgi:hypothetical protein